jgi:hypothetical protein
MRRMGMHPVKLGELTMLPCHLTANGLLLAPVMEQSCYGLSQRERG